jgi:hypothetical protein
MAYDEQLAGRTRQLIGSDPELTEKKMFGGLAFLIRATWPSPPAARVVPRSASIRQSDVLVATTKATHVNMRGRDMPDGYGSVRRSAHRRPARPMGRDRHRVRARCHSSRGRWNALNSDQATLIILMRRCVVDEWSMTKRKLMMAEAVKSCRMQDHREE